MIESAVQRQLARMDRTERSVVHEFVILGAGLAGAATAWHLASRGREVTVVERSLPANRQGSSSGSARIFRYAYPEQHYTDMVVRARSGWDELERSGGTSLLTTTGSVDHGDRRQPRQLADILQASGVDHEMLSPRQAEIRWPQLRFDTDVLWHPAAGVLDAASTVTTMLGLAEHTGHARLLSNWPVKRLECITGGYRVHSSQGGASLDAANVVVAVGGWLPALLGDLSLPRAFLSDFPPLQVRQEQVAHFPYRRAVGLERASEHWPTFIYKNHDGQYYGLPGGRDAQDAGFKVAEFNGGRVIASAVDHDGTVAPAGRRRLVEFASRMLPGVAPAPYAESTCLFTNTPSSDFVMDRVGRLTVLSPCSGHGAKFAPLIGELAADLATGAGGVPDFFRVGTHSKMAAHSEQVR